LVKKTIFTPRQKGLFSKISNRLAQSECPLRSKILKTCVFMYCERERERVSNAFANKKKKGMLLWRASYVVTPW
jgi:hypothetical protein